MTSDKEKLIIYGMYCNFIKDIKHYDSLQTYFRILASTILLGSFVAIGFIFSLKSLTLPFARSFSVIIVMAISCVTLIVFWNIDLIFYEKQLTSHFAEAFKLETQHEWLPKVHHNILYGIHRKDRPSNVVFYYIGCTGSLILTTGIILSFNFLKVHNSITLAIISAVCSILAITLIFIILKKKTKKMKTLIKNLYLKNL